MTPERREWIERILKSGQRSSWDQYSVALEEAMGYIRRLEAVAEAARRVRDSALVASPTMTVAELAEDFDELDARLKELEG